MTRENLIVERAFERGAAHAMAESARFAPGFAEHAVERLERESWHRRRGCRRERVAASRYAETNMAFQLDVHRSVDVGGWALLPGGEHLLLGAADRQADACFFKAQRFRDFADVARYPQNIFRGIVMHLAVRLDVVVKLHDARLSGGRAARSSSSVQVK